MKQSLSKLIPLLLIISIGLNIFLAYGIVSNNQKEDIEVADENKLNIDSSYFTMGSINNISSTDNGYKYQFELNIDSDIANYIDHPYVWQNYGLSIVLHFDVQSIEYSRMLDVFLEDGNHQYTIEIDFTSINDEIVSVINNKQNIYSEISIVNTDTNDSIALLIGGISL